ncbi:hypothetical protein GQ55_4G365000 [Panicum hallii var. hallii]|uniref:Uncharacterized protein n=1 Tax=Panicum hallii var. hallii TaxID=1504633 RepID=A0A2T7E3U4_9POAL|nr:hypothetical protein GQ55_4G365000 [Panicum hallii var. hallii]
MQSCGFGFHDASLPADFFHFICRWGPGRTKELLAPHQSGRIISAPVRVGEDEPLPSLGSCTLPKRVVFRIKGEKRWQKSELK